MKSAFIPPAEIETKAIEFLNNYHPDGSLPIPIEEIIESKLRIKIVLSLDLASYGIDAFTTQDFEEIYIDEKQYSNWENRTRFTLAHEVGHYVLHKSFIDSLKLKNIDKWKEFILNDLQRNPLESQANMFAGFLLMPTESLEREYEKIKSDLASGKEFKGKKLPKDEVLAQYTPRLLSRIFMVSEESAGYRLRNWLNFKNR